MCRKIVQSLSLPHARSATLRKNVTLLVALACVVDNCLFNFFLDFCDCFLFVFLDDFLLFLFFVLTVFLFVFLFDLGCCCVDDSFVTYFLIDAGIYIIYTCNLPFLMRL